jgi:hypothetical protein
VITFDSSSLLAYYQARSGGTSASGGASGTGTTKKNPTPPWSVTSTAPKMSALVTDVLRGGRFIDTSAAKLDVAVKTTAASSDYKNLFGLYQALNALEGLAEQAGAKGVPELQLKTISRRFEAGMNEVQDFLAGSPFKGFDVVQGVSTDKLQTTVGAKAQADTYTTGILYTGPMDGEVPAFQGPAAFQMTAKDLAGNLTTVNFDLSEMGTTPRTMGNVVLYLNDKLQAAGVVTRFSSERTAGVASTTTAGGKTLTLGSVAPDSFALKVKGSASEEISFSAVAQSPAVYVSQLSGKTTGKAAAPVSQFIKLDGTDAAANKVSNQTLGSEVTGIKASVTGPDGSVYVVANIKGKTDGQVIKGETDVALMKYDSAGKLLYTRTLGALDNAKGVAIAISADGAQVAIGGSVTGAFDSKDSTTSLISGEDSFVTVFDSHQGEEVWTQRRGSLNGDDEVDAVSFGADGKVYLAGSTSGPMQGAASNGGRDAYISAFEATKFTPPGGEAPIYTVSTAFTTQFGGAGTDKATGMVVSGSSAYVSSVEDGRAVIRRYDLQPSGAPVLAATRDLGDLMGGKLAGISVGPGGEILVAGSTHNGALNAGTVTNPYGGDGEAFVAKLSGDLQPAGSDRLTYYSGDGDTDVGAMTVSDGKVYIAGRIAGPPTVASGTDPSQQGYVAAIDPDTGAVTWTKRLDGADGTATPTALSVDSTGLSVLDKFGLPKGEMDFSATSNLVAATSLRAGDQFKIRSGSGSAVTITIEATDTYQTLAKKIGRATGFAANASTTTVDGRTQLKIAPANSLSDIQIIAGPDGRNALASLGLQEGVIDKDALNLKTPKNGMPKSTGKLYGLKLPSTIDLSDKTSIHSAQAALMNAITTVQSIYKDMTALVTSAKGGTASTGPSAYMQSRLANYQDALSRLGG